MSDGQPPPVPTRRPSTDSAGVSPVKFNRPLPTVPEPETPPPLPPRAGSISVQRQPSIQRVSDSTYVFTSSHNGSNVVNGPPLSPKQPPGGFDGDTKLENAEWYWGNISREEVIDIMKNCSDGSFLVRDSAKVVGEYTLTLKVGGVNRLIRIIYHDGKYGFSEPLEFNSVVELVNYHKHHSLRPYSYKLDTNLLYPVSKEEMREDDGLIANDVDSIIKALVEAEARMEDLTKQYNDHYSKWSTVHQEINALREKISSEKLIVDMIREHEEIQSKSASFIANTEITAWKDNVECVKRRAQGHGEGVMVMERELACLDRDARDMDMRMQALKPQILKLTESKNFYRKWLLKQGLTDEEIYQRMTEKEEPFSQYEDPHEIYALLHTERSQEQYDRLVMSMESFARSRRQQHYPPTLTRPPKFSSRDESSLDETVAGSMDYSTLPHRNQTTWLSNSISREQSRSLLSTKPNGTFLVRPKDPPECMDREKSIYHTHTLDVMDAHKYKRIAIMRSTNGGYGFADPLEFRSLEHLICHYAHCSLKKHNPEMDTALLKPAFL